MKSFASMLTCLAVLSVPVLGFSQQPVVTGPEQDKLTQLEGVWDATIKLGDAESKGTLTYKVDLGGLWLVSEFQGEIGGAKFAGRGLDSYDPVRKKYISLWADSNAPVPVILEGTFDKEGKVQTMTGEGPGPDGKPQKFQSVTRYVDKNTFHWTMYEPAPDGKMVELLKISYKRRK